LSGVYSVVGLYGSKKKIRPAAGGVRGWIRLWCVWLGGAGHYNHRALSFWCVERERERERESVCVCLVEASKENKWPQLADPEVLSRTEPQTEAQTSEPG